MTECGLYVRESTAFASRLLLNWRRSPLVPMQSVLFPTILLIIYYMLVSKSMTRLVGNDAIEVVVAMCAVAGGMSGALAAALSIPNERKGGLLARFWVLPVRRSSVLAGTLMADAVRTLAGTLILTATGVLLGLRFEGGVAAALVFVMIPVFWVTVYATLIIAIALRTESQTLLTWIGTASLGAVFASSGVAPIDLFPAWLRPIVQLQPLSPTIEAMNELAREGFALRPILWTFTWIAFIGLAAGCWAIRGFKTAAQSAG